jgi:hypothetical protein
VACICLKVSRLGADLFEQFIIPKPQESCAMLQIEFGNKDVALVRASLAQEWPESVGTSLT